MKEEFYQQVREFGVLISRGNYFECWVVKGCGITITFNDKEHKQVDNITL